MRAFSDLPRSVLLSEALGVLLLIFAVLTLQQLLSLPFDLSPHRTARWLAVAGILLMLPAAGVMIWRTVRAWLPGRHQ